MLDPFLAPETSLMKILTRTDCDAASNAYADFGVEPRAGPFTGGRAAAPSCTWLGVLRPRNFTYLKQVDRTPFNEEASSPGFETPGGSLQGLDFFLRTRGWIPGAPRDICQLSSKKTRKTQDLWTRPGLIWESSRALKACLSNPVEVCSGSAGTIWHSTRRQWWLLQVCF
jgi:hypothetical protein